MAVEVTLGTGMSCISSVSRGEDNGSDNEDNLDDGQQGRTPPRLSVPCENRAIQTDMQARLPLLADFVAEVGDDRSWRAGANFLS